MQLLRRKKIRRDILLQYLAKKSIAVGIATDKVSERKSLFSHSIRYYSLFRLS
jgi:hypothetical protein